MRRTKERNFDFHVKEMSDAGIFEGYASVYEELDSYREVVAKGAFERTLGEWETKGRMPPILWQHSSRDPIGPILDLKEDSYGLRIRGHLLVDDVPLAKQARALMKANAVTGMSIGFNVYEEEYNAKQNVTTLKSIDLWEVSVATFPAMASARVEDVKQFLTGGDLPSIKEFEEYLRDAGFSRTQAKAICGHGYGALLRDVESAKAVDIQGIINDITGALRA